MAEPPITQPEAPPPPAPGARRTETEPSRQAGSSSAHRQTRSAVEPDGHPLRSPARAGPGVRPFGAEPEGVGCGHHGLLRRQQHGSGHGRAVYLMPFAGIAFLWHMNTVRLLIRSRTPEPSAIPDGLQLMAGILFVVLLFAGTASSGAVALLKDLTMVRCRRMDVVRGLLAVGYSMVFVYSVRGAGMYALTTTTLLANAKIMPRWLAVVGPTCWPSSCW